MVRPCKKHYPAYVRLLKAAIPNVKNGNPVCSSIELASFGLSREYAERADELMNWIQFKIYPCGYVTEWLTLKHNIRLLEIEYASYRLAWVNDMIKQFGGKP